MKICIKCKEQKELSQFNKNKSHKDGKSTYCRDCESLNNKKNRENRENRMGRENYLIKLREDWQKNNTSNKYKLKRKNRRNKQQFRRLALSINFESKRKERKRTKFNAGKVTPQELWSLAKKQKLRCAISGIKLTNENICADHIIPLSKNGSNSIDNIQLVDYDVNQMKFALLVREFLQLIETIHNYQKSKQPLNPV